MTDGTRALVAQLREALGCVVQCDDVGLMQTNATIEQARTAIAAADQWLGKPETDRAQRMRDAGHTRRPTTMALASLEPLTDEQIVSWAMEAGDLAELCILRDYCPELGAVPEHWVPREHVRRLVRAIDRARGC